MNKISVPKIRHKIIDGKKVAYRRIGKGVPMFCFPGWTLSSISYLPLAHLLKGKVSLIMIDIPGWSGDSERMKVRTTISYYSHICGEFILSFGYKRYYVLGYSFGGALSQKMLKEGVVNPEKLILVSSLHNGKGILKDPFLVNIRHFHQTFRKFYSPDIFVRTVTMAFSNHKRKNTMSKNRLGVNLSGQIRNSLFRGGLKPVVYSGLSLIRDEYFSEKLKNIKTLVLFANDDIPFIKRSSAEIAEYLRIRPVVVKGDHNHILFNPKVSASHILNFLKN